MRPPQIGFPQLVQDFFVRRLVAQRGASARTVEAYRDAFELLLGFAEQRTGKPPSALQLADLDAPLVLDFLDHLETVRGNSARTRNARLAAIHSFMRYAAVRDPASLPVTARVLAIPAKRFDRPVLGYLSREQVTAILAAPDQRTWTGQRDAVLLATAYNTGARVSELTALQVRDVLLHRQTAVLSRTAKAASSASSRYGRPPLPSCAPGWARPVPHPARRCSLTGPARR
jgi:integrase/recombinase XerD